MQERLTIDGNAEIARQWRRWKRSGGKVVQGIINRREREIAHFFNGFGEPTEDDANMRSAPAPFGAAENYGDIDIAEGKRGE